MAIELYGIQDVGVFDQKELEHIKALNKRKKALAKEKDVGYTHKDKERELDALCWIFTLLNEISEED